MCALVVSWLCLDCVLVVCSLCVGGVLIESWLRLSYLMVVCRLCRGGYVLVLP